MVGLQESQKDIAEYFSLTPPFEGITEMLLRCWCGSISTAKNRSTSCTSFGVPDRQGLFHSQSQNHGDCMSSLLRILTVICFGSFMIFPPQNAKRIRNSLQEHK